MNIDLLSGTKEPAEKYFLNGFCRFRFFLPPYAEVIGNDSYVMAACTLVHRPQKLSRHHALAPRMALSVTGYTRVIRGTTWRLFSKLFSACESASVRFLSIQKKKRKKKQEMAWCSSRLSSVHTLYMSTLTHCYIHICRRRDHIDPSLQTLFGGHRFMFRFNLNFRSIRELQGRHLGRVAPFPRARRPEGSLAFPAHKIVFRKRKRSLPMSPIHYSSPLRLRRLRRVYIF